MTATLTVGGATINDDFDTIKTGLGRSDVQIENLGDSIIILNEDGSELSAGDQTTVSGLSIFS